MEWISVENGLPDPKEYVDVWSLGERFTDVQYTKSKGFRQYDSTFGMTEIDEVSHWMPLPPPPSNKEK